MHKGDCRGVDPQHLADLVAPHTGAINQYFTLDVTLLCFDGCDPVFVEFKTVYQVIAINFGTPTAGPLGQGLGDTGRIGLAVGRHIGRGDETVQGYNRAKIVSFLGRDDVHLQPEAAGSGGAFFQLIHAFFGAGQVQAATHFPAGGKAGLFLELVI